jgi:hypothetical protein
MEKVVCKIQEDCLRADINPECCVTCEENKNWDEERVKEIRKEIINCFETVEKLVELLEVNNKLPKEVVENSKNRANRIQNELGIFDHNKK